jgi:hypothetical protein
MSCRPALLPGLARVSGPVALRRSSAARHLSIPAAVEFDSDTVTAVIAVVAGLGAGIGVPVAFTLSEQRDKQRIEAIREMNRATLKATGETLSEARAFPPSSRSRQPLAGCNLHYNLWSGNHCRSTLTLFGCAWL